MKKQYKEMYRQVKKPLLFEAQKQNIITIKGTGGPNTEEFTQAIQALYQLSYAFRMSYKSEEPIENFELYTVGPLEGFWGTIDNKMYDQDKTKLTYELLIVQPDFVTETIFNKYQAQLLDKNPSVANVEYKINEEGLVGQIMHVGPYETEDESIAKLKEFLAEQNLHLLHSTHHEIYLSDFRRVAPEKLKTILRFKVSENNEEL